MSAGRIGCYIHSDKSVGSKGACLVKVLCVTDFAARSPEFIQFTEMVAKYAYGFGQDGIEWVDLVKAVGFIGDGTATLHNSLAGVAYVLKEKIKVAEIVVMRL